jgi:hypothetical protein
MYRQGKMTATVSVCPSQWYMQKHAAPITLDADHTTAIVMVIDPANRSTPRSSDRRGSDTRCMTLSSIALNLTKRMP